MDLNGFVSPGQGTLQRKNESKEEHQDRLNELSGAMRTILKCMGEDLDREGLRDTPERYAKAMLFLTSGYQESIQTLANNAVFQEGHDEMVIVRNIEFSSLCEHHILPFFGTIHVGYVPDHCVIGLSKVVRIVEMFSRRLQVQERLTEQVASTLSTLIQLKGVAVVVEATHLCMKMRGVQKAGSITTTSYMLGCLRSNTARRSEFFRLIDQRDKCSSVL